MFATIKRMMYEQIREDGRVEGRVAGREEGRVEGIAEGRVEGIAEGSAKVNADWQAWYDRRTATGVFIHDDNDPPPTQRKDKP